MALKEGRCLNCGSLLFLDPDMPKGHCLFCDCVFDNEEAFRANENPELFTFPNEKQPPYEGPSLTPGRARRGPVEMAPATPAISVEAREEKYQLPASKVPTLKIPTRAITVFIVSTLLILGIFGAVTFPLVAKRNQRQADIAEKFASQVAYTVDKEKDIRVLGMSGTDAVLILPADISAREGLELFNLYCDIRADVMDLKDRSFKSMKKPVTIRIATPGGGYLIDQPADETSLQPEVLVPSE